MVFRNLPAPAVLIRMADLRVRREQRHGIGHHTQLEIHVLHGCKWKALIETANPFEQLTAYGQIARPEMSSGFIGRSFVSEAPLFSNRGDAALKDTRIRMFSRISAVVLDQRLFGNAIIIEKNDQFAVSVSRPVIPVRSRSLLRPLDNLDRRKLSLDS